MNVEGAKADEDLAPTRHSLLLRLRDWNDQESWRSFFESYWKLIYTTALRAGLTEAESQDVVQETVVSVLKSLPRYDPAKGSFKHWLLRLTEWRITDQLRRRQKCIAEPSRRRDATSSRTATVERLVDPAGLGLDQAWDEEWENNLLEVARERVKSKVDSKHYQVFDLLVFKQWPISRVVQSMRVSRARVYLIKHRVGNLFKKEVSRLRANPI
jgi:RNA polymerase sigma-70 factor (ECF subfamily)